MSNISYGTTGGVFTTLRDTSGAPPAGGTMGGIFTMLRDTSSGQLFDDQLNNFLSAIMVTWPEPEIVYLNFDKSLASGKVEQISTKVKVSGDFLDNAWFWDDFLKYYKFLKMSWISLNFSRFWRDRGTFLEPSAENGSVKRLKTKI